MFVYTLLVIFQRQQHLKFVSIGQRTLDGFLKTQTTILTLQMFTGHYGVSAGFPCFGETL